ncbi:MAG: DoxX family protein [Alphaproteobacteria bacterium]|nr:DoxX family protein [Alphaproteobacteria bacterium]
MPVTVSDSWLPAAARALIAAAFIWSGAINLFAFMGEFSRLYLSTMSMGSRFMPLLIILELGGGVAFLLGLEIRRSALVLLAALTLDQILSGPIPAGGNWLLLRGDPPVLHLHRTIILAGGLLLAMVYEANQARSPTETDAGIGLVPLLGRLCIGGMIAAYAVRDVIDFAMVTTTLSQEGVPLAPVVVIAGIAIRLLAGWALVIGFWTRLVAMVLFVHTIIAENPAYAILRYLNGHAETDLYAAHIALGLTGGLILAFLKEGARRRRRPLAKPAQALAARPVESGTT